MLSAIKIPNDAKGARSFPDTRAADCIGLVVERSLGTYEFGQESGILIGMKEQDREPFEYVRNRQLLSADHSALLLVDVQQKLLDVIPNGKHARWNIQRLCEGASVFGIPVVATEQYPEKLGPTVASLAKYVDGPLPKMAFSCVGCGQLESKLADRGVEKVLVVGIETHVCVLQTCFDLLVMGYEVYTAVDAVATRNPIDHEIALRRMDSAGITLCTTEMALFEWCEQSGTAEFKKISQIVKTPPPE